MASSRISQEQTLSNEDAAFSRDLFSGYTETNNFQTMFHSKDT